MSAVDPGDALEFVILDCSAVIADIYLLLDDECDDSARARLLAHIDECPSCLEHYGIERQIKELVARKCGCVRAPESLKSRLRLEIFRSVTITTTIEVEVQQSPDE